MAGKETYGLKKRRGFPALIWIIGEAISGHVLLAKGERSPLAELAANIL